MRFNCLKEDIVRILDVALKAVDTKPALPQLAGVYLEAAGGFLHVQTTNNRLGIKAKFAIDDQGDGVAVVNARKLAAIVKNMPSETIAFELNTEDKLLDVMSGRTRFSLHTIGDANYFPTVKTTDAATLFSLRGDKLQWLIDSTVIACAGAEADLIYTTCNVSLKDGALTFVGTNKHRLMYSRAVVDSSADFKINVPSESLKAVSAYLTDETVDVKSDGKSIIIEVGNILFKARLFEGDFPGWTSALPKDNNIEVTVETKNLIAALNRALLIEADNKNVELKKTAYGLTVASRNARVGTCEEYVDADIAGEEFDAHWNAKYLLDALKSFGTKCKFYMHKDKFFPVHIRDIDNDSGYVLTPLRISA